MKYLQYVNIKMGTDSHERSSRGNTLPLTQRPFGMNSFCLQTYSAARRAWFYNPSCDFAEGVRLTHQPSPWIGDFGTVLMMPACDCVGNRASAAWSGIDKARTVEAPDYLGVYFRRTESSFELTPTERCAAVRLSFSDDRQKYLSFLPVLGNYTYSFDAENSVLLGTSDFHQSDKSVNFCMYFAVKFLNGAASAEKSYGAGEGNDAAFHVALSGKVVEARIGVSYISHSMALEAIERECRGKSFDELRGEAAADWEEHLSRIEIESDSEDTMRTFYSCLYRTFLYPSKAYEIDSSGKLLHYAPSDGSVREGVRYTNNGFWDTARTVYPLFSIIAREEFAEMLSGFVNDYLECGWLPRWLSLGEVGCMPSTLIDAVIAEAAVQGIGSHKVLECALSGMLHHANEESDNPKYGRNGARSYCRLGYVPSDEQKESVNLTLDAAYGDWCIATVAGVLGRDELVGEYMRRSKNYKNIFDPECGFMRGRDKDGRMKESFDPYSWGGDYTEGSAWQNSFFVPHDIEGLAELYGGKDKLIAKLDELFSSKPTYRVFGYGREIHEMTELARADFGQCAISNQPSFHIPFLYAQLGEQQKTDYWVKRMATEAFSWRDGYPGDEDNGSMSAWYIFATLGFYPTCPGSGKYTRCERLVRSAKILGKKI